jgi:hypothetical protein
MSRAIRKSANYTATVIPIRPNMGQLSLAQPVSHESLDEILGEVQEEEQVKLWFEAAAVEILLKMMQSETRIEENAFDSIYLAELSSDLLNEENVKEILARRHIQDLSDLITFKDEWND